jgi:hypothetical protein
MSSSSDVIVVGGNREYIIASFCAQAADANEPSS